jgi:phosphate transport system protein
MTKHFLHQTEHLKKKILHLTALVEDNMRNAVRSVTELNRELAERVVQADEEIDAYEVEIEEDCLKTLALYQPVAVDLRFIVAVLKINNDLERIGDLATNIAQRTDSLHKHKGERVPYDMGRMLTKTMAMVQASADALVASDIVIARQVLEADQEIDSLHHDAYAQTQAEIQKKPELVEYYISLLSVSRNLERIADHATNIAEDVIYMVEGEIIRHGNGL